MHPDSVKSNADYVISQGFSVNGEQTLSIIDPDDEFLLGNSEDDISHYDLMGISNYYECTSKLIYKCILYFLFNHGKYSQLLLQPPMGLSKNGQNSTVVE